MRFKAILRNINLLNMLLILALVLFAAYRISPLLTVKIKYALPPAKKMEEKVEEKASQPQIPSITEYAVISEQNLFHPERRIPPEKKDEEALPKPDFVLYGTLISDDVKLAYLEDLKAPRTTPGRGKRLTAMKKGDSMSGFTLKDIEPDKVIMARGEEQITVSINDPAHPKTREGQTTASEQPQQHPAPGTHGPSAAQQRPAARPGGSSNVQQHTPSPSARSGQRSTIRPSPLPSASSTRRRGGIGEVPQSLR